MSKMSDLLQHCGVHQCFRHDESVSLQKTQTKMIQDNLVTVAHAQLEAIAEMMRGRLEAEGIEAVTRGNRVAGAAGFVNEFNISWSNPLGGVEVRVRPEDVARAREILAVDEREEADFKDREPMPWAVRATGAGAVAGVVWWIVMALSENWVAAMMCALISFIVMLALGKRRI